jgi:hypothetical protein
VLAKSHGIIIYDIDFRSEHIYIYRDFKGRRDLVDHVLSFSGLADVLIVNLRLLNLSGSSRRQKWAGDLSGRHWVARILFCRTGKTVRAEKENEYES